jgi:SAM-dependent methyltransferase
MSQLPAKSKAANQKRKKHVGIRSYLLRRIRWAVGYHALEERLSSIESRLASIAASIEDRGQDIVSILLDERPVAADQTSIATDHPVAIYSDDHKFPRGARNDSTRSPRFVFACERIFGRKISHLDLGCAGGGLVWDFTLRGHQSYGVEGSDYSYLEQRAEWRTIPGNLFTADITKPFTLLRNGQAVTFDVITAWEVLEHIPENLIDGLLDNVVCHLAQGGLFVASVATFEDKDPNTGAVWHVTIRPFEWWHARFEKKGLRLEHHVFNPRDFVRGSGNPRADDWDASVNPEMGFHIVYKLP